MKYVKWIAAALSLVLLIVGAYLLYNELGKDRGGDGLIVETPSGTPSGTTADSVESGNAESDNTESDNTSSGANTTRESNPAPDFSAVDMDGNSVKLSDMKGKPVVVNFWATWCYYCKIEMPDFEEVYRECGDEVTFMMVNMTDGVKETMTDAKAHIETNGYTFPVYFDTKFEASEAYSVTGLPATYFIDAEGNLVARANGAIDAETLKKGIDMIK